MRRSALVLVAQVVCGLAIAVITVDAAAAAAFARVLPPELQRTAHVLLGAPLPADDTTRVGARAEPTPSAVPTERSTPSAPAARGSRPATPRALRTVPSPPVPTGTVSRPVVAPGRPIPPIVVRPTTHPKRHHSATGPTRPVASPAPTPHRSDRSDGSDDGDGAHETGGSGVSDD